MHNFSPRFSFSPVGLCGTGVAVLAVTYICLIAVVMSYAAVTMEFSQSVKNEKATVAVLESRYLTALERLTSTDHVTEGYALPVTQAFVPAKSVTARR